MNTIFSRITRYALLIILFPVSFIKSYSAEKKPILKDHQLSFTENKGQLFSGMFKNDVLYYLQGSGVNCFLKKDGLSYVWYTSDNQKKASQLNLKFLHANQQVKVHSEEATNDVNNYYLEHCPKGILGVRNFKKVTYENIYDKIDLVFYVADGNDKASSIPIKYDFVVKPGGDPNQIKINYTGSKNLKLNKDGSLTAQCSIGELNEGKPFSYQNQFEKREIASAYQMEQGNILSFRLSSYNKNEDLIIDPSVQWASYYGGTAQEEFGQAETDATGNVYLSGRAKSPGLSYSNPYEPNLIGTNENGIIVKFDPRGARLWATYIGGDTRIHDICLDKSEANVYAITTADILIKFNVDGLFQWKKVIGAHTIPFSVAADDNYVYVAGFAHANSGVTTPDGQFPTITGGSAAFLNKFNASNGNRIWGTYYGNNRTGQFFSNCYVAIDNLGNSYITGTTMDDTDPTVYDIATAGTHQTSPGGDWDAYLAKFNANGVRQWGTYYGGAQKDNPLNITVDAANEPIITGITQSVSQIAYGTSHQSSLGGAQDLFVAKFNTSGGIKWATYYGGSGTEGKDYLDIVGISTTPDKKIYICSSTNSTNNIATTTGDEVQTNQGGYDAFLVRFDEFGARQWASYYGGSGTDYGEDIDVNASGNMVIAGYTNSTSGIALNNGHQPALSGAYDLFVARYGLRINTISLTPSTTLTCNSSRTVAFTTSGGSFNPGNQFTAQLSDENGSFAQPVVIGSGSSSPITVTIPYLKPGSNYRIRVVSSDPWVVGTNIGPFSAVVSTLTGSNSSYPINVGTLTCGTVYQDPRNNLKANCYGDDYNETKNALQIEGQSSDDVYYKFTLSQAQTVVIATCNSSLDTYIHLLDAAQTHIASNDDNGPLCVGASSKASIVRSLPAGDYFVVVEGYGPTEGAYTLQISLPMALKFTQAGDGVELADNLALQLNTGNFTMEAKVKIPVGHNTYTPILSNRTTYSPPNGFLFGISYEGKLFPQIGGVPYYAPASSPNLYDGLCHHIALTRSSGTLKYYVDGALIHTVTATGNMDAGNLRIGKDNGMTSAVLDSWIWNVRIWNVARTQTELQNNMNVMLNPQSGLIGYWPILEGTDQKVTDFSGNQITGILGTTLSAEAADPIWSCTGCSPISPVPPVEVSTDISSITETDELIVYPNPFNESTNILVKGKGERGVLEITDVNGKVVYRNENYITNETVTLGEKFQSGFYILRIATAEGIKSLKLVKTE